MTSHIEFPAFLIRRFGYILLLMSVLLPVSVMWIKSRNQMSPEGLPELRPEMIVLPAGTFMMGATPKDPDAEGDETPHEVSLTRPFAISRTEVTQQQYQFVMGQEQSRSCSGVVGDVGRGDNLPVVCVTWFEAVAYANRLSKFENLNPAYQIDGQDVTLISPATDGYRLPTEAEWEYAARAGTATIYVGTDDPAKVCNYANVLDKTGEKEIESSGFPCDDRFAYLAPVNALAPNVWWLRGFGGNVSEWVWDAYAEYDLNKTEDPIVFDGTVRVIRGGSFRNSPRYARAADRFRYVPADRFDFLGFRLSRSCPSALLPSECFQK